MASSPKFIAGVRKFGKDGSASPAAIGMNGSTLPPRGGANESNDNEAVVGAGESECPLSGDAALDVVESPPCPELELRVAVGRRGRLASGAARRPLRKRP
jgi:hypothetical protein